MDLYFSFKDRKPISGIYCIVNLINNKKYIGSSKNLLVRLEKHRSLLRNNKHENSYLQNAWNKYGEENFICCLFEVHEVYNNLFLVEREQYWINFINPEYNLTTSVIRNVLSKESRIKQSETRKKLFSEGKLIPSRRRQINQYDLEGNFVRTWASISEAFRQTGIHESTICRCLSKECGQGRGYIWKYVEDVTENLPIVKGKLTKIQRPFKIG
jgi:hypothetical protein